jgi:hypothetical protein
MITKIRQLMLEHPEWLRSSHVPLSFMKFSTPTSGMVADKGKVLIFVFEEGEISPTLCIKTTRIYSAVSIIKRNHDNLKLLQEGVTGSEYAQMFAKPLYLYDDGSIIFSVETVCPGAIFSAGTHGVESVMDKYIAWQSYLARGINEFRELENGIRLPVLVQHGDMTPDNVLVLNQEVYLIDCDYAGKGWLPGFDLFNFLSKLKLSPEMLRYYYELHFPRYFKSIGAHIESYEILIPFYQREEGNRKMRKL